DEGADGIAAPDLAPAEVEHPVLGERVGVAVGIAPVEGEQVARLQVLDLRAILPVAADVRPAAGGQGQRRGREACGQSASPHRFLPPLSPGASWPGGHAMPIQGGGCNSTVARSMVSRDGGGSGFPVESSSTAHATSTASAM